MKPATLLADLRRRGVELSLSGEDLIYRAPKGSVTADVISTLKSHKSSIIGELKAELSSHDEFENLSRIIELDDDPSAQPSHPYSRYVEPVKSRLLSRVGLDVNYARGDGCYLWDHNNNRYLDCIAQYGALPFGYNHPSIWNAIDEVREQQLPNVATQSMLDTAGQLAEKLLSCFPPSFTNVIFSNSGAESIEVAIKLCRAAKNRPGILSTRNGFHGLTTGSLSATGSESFQDGFFVRCHDFQHVHFGVADALESKLVENPGHFAAFIVEPIQGEAGIVCPPDGYLQQVRDICKRHDVLLVFDEVQTGLGRTGDMFAFEFEQVVPDVVTIAKALGGGLMPCGAIVCGANVYSTHFGLRHSSTFAGNAMAAKCGLASIGLLQADSYQLVKNVQSVGDRLKTGLEKIKRAFPDLVANVRGRGFMQAIEFDFSSLDQRQGLLPVLAEQGILLHLMISHLLHEHRVRLAPTFMGRNIIRIEPPLVFNHSQCDDLLDALHATLQQIAMGNSASMVCHMFELPEERRKTIAASRAHNVVFKTVQATNKPKSLREFGFLVHLRDLNDLVEFDSTLTQFETTELAELKHQLTRASEPTVIGHTTIVSPTGDTARGHFVLVPYTPEELVNMSSPRAIKQINKAAFAAAEQDVSLIGLGGFTSILTLGGVALDCDELPPITSGNAFTAAATIQAIESAARASNRSIGECEVAVVGAAGQIGRVVSMLMARKAKRLVLVGRDGKEPRTQQNLANLANEIASAGNNPLTSNDIECAEHINRIRDSEIVVLVSSATEAFIDSTMIKSGAIVCDSSRPANVSPDVIAARRDVRWIEGGLIKLPGNPVLDLFAGPTPDAAYACVAETALWALEPSLGIPSARQILDVATVERLLDASNRHGFKVIV